MPARQRVPAHAAVSVDVGPLLDAGVMEIEGRLIDASNATFVADLTLDGLTRASTSRSRGERPLWDFPDGTLAGREVAAYLVSEATGWASCRRPCCATGRSGRAWCQLWIDTDDAVELVDLDAGRPGAATGWLRVLDAEDQSATPIVAGPRRRPALRPDGRLRRGRQQRRPQGRPRAARPPDGAVLGVDHGVDVPRRPQAAHRPVGVGRRTAPDAEPRRCSTGWRARLDESTRLPTLCALHLAAARSRAPRRIAPAAAPRRFPVRGRAWPSIPWPPF